jgi:polyisoprenoid-binding protein YceI
MALENWNFDTVHSHVGFSVRHLMISKVNGMFKVWSGTLATDEANPPSASVDVAIDATSIDTQDPQRDEHLRSADFLDVAKFPQITFKSTKVAKVGDDKFNVTGLLTIRGVSKQVVLDTEFAGRQKDPWGGERSGFSAKTVIDRKDFDLNFNIPLEGGGVVVGEKVTITLEIEAMKVATQASGGGGNVGA